MGTRRNNLWISGLKLICRRFIFCDDTCHESGKKGRAPWGARPHIIDDIGVRVHHDFVFADVAGAQLGEQLEVGGHLLALVQVDQELAVADAAVPRVISVLATGRRNAGPMDENEKYLKFGPGWDHLVLRDTRSDEEKRAAESKERARRRGRSTKGWHQKYIDENGSLRD